MREEIFQDGPLTCLASWCWMLVEVSVLLPWLLECLPNQRAGGSHNGICNPSSKVISYAHHCVLFITQGSLNSAWVQTTCVRVTGSILEAGYGYCGFPWVSHWLFHLSQVTRRLWGVYVLTEVWFHVGIYLALFFQHRPHSSSLLGLPYNTWLPWELPCTYIPLTS